MLKSSRVDGKPGDQGLSQRPAYPDDIRRGQQRQKLSRTRRQLPAVVQTLKYETAMAHVQEIAEDAVSTLQRADVVGKQNLSKQMNVPGHNTAKCIWRCLQHIKKINKNQPSLTGEKFCCSI